MRPAQPTTAKPGSESKIVVFQYRVQHRQELFHPRDFREPIKLPLIIRPTGLDRVVLKTK